MRLAWSGRWGPAPLRLVLDPDAVRDPRDVVEVADHLYRVRDRRVVETLRAKSVDVGLLCLGGVVSELHGEVAERTLAWGEIRPAVVFPLLLRNLVVCALGTEVVGVCRRSVMAALLG